MEFSFDIRGYLKPYERSKENYGIDGYVIRIYPKGHEKYIRTQSDLLYWEHWFSQSRKNRKKQRFPKGFVELEL